MRIAKQNFRLQIFTLSLTICASLIMSPDANADEIFFEHDGTGSGTLAGESFESSAFSIFAIGDTQDRVEIDGVDGFFIEHLSASIEISDLGTFDFVSGTLTFVSNDFEVVGFSL